MFVRFSRTPYKKKSRWESQDRLFFTSLHLNLFLSWAKSAEHVASQVRKYVTPEFLQHHLEYVGLCIVFPCNFLTIFWASSDFFLLCINREKEDSTQFRGLIILCIFTAVVFSIFFGLFNSDFNVCFISLTFWVILITQNRDIKTRDVAHCVSSLLRKLAMLASDDKIAMLREELRMPRLLVQPFPACYSVRAKWDRRDVNNDR